mgnify:CR=1 FL=1
MNRCPRVGDPNSSTTRPSIPPAVSRANADTEPQPNAHHFDAGVYRSLRASAPLDRSEEIDGSAFEGLIAQHLRARIAYSGSDCELFYWRTRAGVEVDFDDVEIASLDARCPLGAAKDPRARQPVYHLPDHAGQHDQPDEDHDRDRVTRDPKRKYGPNQCQWNRE